MTMHCVASELPAPMSSTAWPQHIPAAMATWGRVTENELLLSDGRIKPLAGLIRDRYWLSRAEADQQVRRFLREQTC